MAGEGKQRSQQERRTIGGKVYQGNWAAAHNDSAGAGEVLVGIATCQDRLGTFEGTFDAELLFHGAGARTFANGDMYSGAYVHGKRHGIGTYSFANGDRFEGVFEDNNMKNGVFRWREGDTFQGDFENQLPHGKGTKHMRNGSKFCGDWVQGRAQGWGIKTFACGDVHQGFYRDNLRHGFGKYKWLNGQVVEGFWVNGRITGRARKTFGNGDEFVGEFVQDRATGVGTQVNAMIGTIHVGNYVGGKREGWGTLAHDHQSSGFNGNFRSGYLSGIGTHVFPSMNVFFGEWDHSCAHGIGAKLFRLGSATLARYFGEFCRDQRHGLGFYEWQDGTFYEGGWRLGKLDGYGEMEGKGWKLRGYFSEGELHGHCIEELSSKGFLLARVWNHGVPHASQVLCPSNLHRAGVLQLSAPSTSEQSVEELASAFLSNDPSRRRSGEEPSTLRIFPSFSELRQLSARDHPHAEQRVTEFYSRSR